MEDKSDFFDSVYQVVRLVPEGRVTSYGAIARFLGSPKSSRLVGYAMNASHSQKEPVPAHRVVNRLGMLSGKNHFGNPFLMQQLLEQEGIIVVNDQVQDFERLFWDPNEQIKI